MKKLILLLFTIPLITGCTSINTTITINPNKSAEIQTSLLYNGDLSKNTEENKFINETSKIYLDNEYTINTEYLDDITKITATKEVKNITKNDLDLKSLGFEPENSNGKFLSIKKSFWATAYIFNAKYDYKKNKKRIETLKEEQQQNDNKIKISKTFEPEYYKKYADPEEVQIDEENRDDFLSNLDESAKKLAIEDVKDAEEEINKTKPQNDSNADMTFIIKLPIPVAITNADKVTGNIYIWDINKDKPTIIEAKYIDYHGIAVLLAILIGIGFFVYIAKRVYKHDSLKRIENNDVPKLHSK